MTTHDPEYGSGALEMIQTGITELSTSVAGWLETIGEDVDGALSLLADIRSRRTALAEIEALVEAHAAQVMPHNRAVLGDGRVAKRGPSSRPTGWQHRDLVFAVVGEVTTDPITGAEIGDRQTAVRVAEALLKAAGIGYWRAGELGQLGIDADQYCTRERVRRTVQITGAEAGQ